MLAHELKKDTNNKQLVNTKELTKKIEKKELYPAKQLYTIPFHNLVLSVISRKLYFATCANCVPVSIDSDLKNKRTKAHDLAGGHKKNFKVLNDKIWKFNVNQKEFSFYQNMREDSKNPNSPDYDLSKIVPLSFENSKLPENAIEMQNVKYGLKDAKDLDIKIGFRTMSQFGLMQVGDNLIKRASRKLYAKMKDFATRSSAHGFRVTGGKGLSKSYFREFVNGSHSRQIIKSLIKNKNLSNELIVNIYNQISEIKKAALKSNYAFVDSSIYLAFDQNEARAKLLDFAFVLKKDENPKSINNKRVQKYQKRFDASMQCLLNEFEKNMPELKKKV